MSQKKLCKVNSPFSSSSSSDEEQEFSSQNLAESGREHAGPSAGLLEFAPIINMQCAVSLRMSRDKFLVLVTMF
jgi:hypothetical protein